MKKLLMLIILFFPLHACTAPSASISLPPSGSLAAQTHHQETYITSLAALVQWERDEYLASTCTSQADAVDCLRVKAIYPELQLRPDCPKTVIVLFSVENVPHAAGADRTIALLLNQETSSFIDQVTVTADKVSPYFLDESNILFLNTVSYAGMNSYSLSLLQTTPDGWVIADPTSLFPPQFAPAESTELCYAVTEQKPLLLHIFEMSYKDNPMAQPDCIFKQTFTWDKDAHLFLPVSTEDSTY